MNRSIDCLIIGNILMDFRKHEKMVRQTGTHSAAYRDLNNNFLQFNIQALNGAEIFDLFGLNRGSSSIDSIAMQMVAAFLKLREITLIKWIQNLISCKFKRIKIYLK